MTTTTRVPFGVHSMVSRLTDVLVQPPHAAFGAAFSRSEHGFRHLVDLQRARDEHRRFVRLLEELGVTVHLLGADDHPSPDLVYAYDPALVTDGGAILLRSGKPTRRGEEEALGAWFRRNGIPLVGAIEEPGTVDGGDVFWLRPDLVCVGRSLRTNQSGIDQLRSLLDVQVEVFDLPYASGPGECLHLLSVISPLTDDLAIVELPRLPVGLHALLEQVGVRMIEVPEDEVASLGCNVLTVEPGVAVMVSGNPGTRNRLEAAGVEVHLFEGREICLNGSGGPTCLTRPIHRI